MALHDTSTFNVEASVNSWWQTQIAAWTFPAWFGAFPSDRVVFNMPEKALQLPCFSVTHIPIMVADTYQGRHGAGTEKAMWSRSLADVSCWVTRTNVNWNAQRNYMASVVSQLVVGTTEITITNYSTDVSSPAATNYIVRYTGIEAKQVTPDPNPDIERIRILMSYEWIIRSS